MLDTLDHVVVAVADLGAALRRCELLLGRPVSWRGEHPGKGTANALFRLENTYLELLAPHGDGPRGAALRRRLEEHGEGLVALAFGTADIAACAAAWRAAGLAKQAPVDALGRDTDSGAMRRWATLDADIAETRGVFVFAIEHRSPADVLPLCAPRVAASAAVEALDHVVVLSPDIEASRRLYAERLGLRLALDRSFEERRARLLFFRVGGATVEVGGRLGAEPHPEAPDRFGGLAWRVPDADAARARLCDAGLDVSEVRAGAKPGTRVFTLRGEPFGVPMLFIAAAA